MAYLDAVQDADHIGAMQDTLLSKRIEAEKYITNEITELITQTVRKVSSKHLSAPFVSYANAPAGRVHTRPLAEVVADTCSDGKPLDALMAVMEKSDCPLVAAWREAMAADYIYRNASDIGEITA